MIGWRDWPELTAQLATLTRGLVDLERAVSLPWGWAAPVDLDGLTAVVELIHEQGRALCGKH